MALSLGHLSSIIVKKVINSNNLPCSSESSDEYVCDACQKGKSHQLPYHKSFSESSAPLELVFQIFGVLPLSPLDERNTMSVLSMISVNLFGST
jgi:hypothetical protein